jgi:gluconokinase
MPSDSLTASVKPAEAQDPLVLALDVGTSSARAIAYDALGRTVEEAQARIPYEMEITPDGGVEIDANRLLALTSASIDALLRDASRLRGRLCGVACSTFWHSLVGVSGEDEALTPVYSWNDTRSRDDAAALAERLGAERVHSLTGCLPHASYWPAKLLWLRRTEPALFERVARWMSFGEYLYLRLFGRTLCSVSMASGTGLFDPNACAWAAELLAAGGIATSQLSPLAADEQALRGLASAYAVRWPALAELPWLPAVGDGACSNVGSGCITRESANLMVGTSGAMRVCWPADRVRIPRGLWCYRANRRYVLLGGALSNAGDVYAWCTHNLRLEPAEVEAQLAALEPDGHGLTVLPFFSGERSTGWADHARATVTGMTLSTRSTEILRAALEAVAYRFAAIYERLREEIPDAARVVASGGGILHSPAWTQMMADVLGVPVIASAVPEASSRGAALLALESLGHLRDLGTVPAPSGTAHEPEKSLHELYSRGRARQELLYDLLIAQKL